MLVIGAGPVGSHVACKLAETGHQVLVLEQKGMPGGKACCTGIVSQECVDSFAIDDSVILRRANSASLFSPSGGVLRLRREKVQACILDRTAFDVNMVGRAQAKGVEYVFNSLVKYISFGDDEVEVDANRREERLKFQARTAVIATGFDSKLVNRLGLGKVGDFVMGAQADVETCRVDEVEVYFGRVIAPGFFSWLVPTTPNMARVGLLSRRSSGTYLKKLISSLVAQGKIIPGAVELNYGGIPLKPLPKTYGKRLLVVGDAAGQVKPTTGGGIYYGLLCADIAAGTLQQALHKDDLSVRSLARYEREWKKKLRWELEVDYYARKFCECLSDKRIDRIFDIIKSSGADQDLLGAEDLSFDWHSKALMRLMGNRAVSRALEAMNTPFRLRGRIW
ncbi:geranylgeranyl reductase family protein [Chloroflexota bacterium]